MTDSDSTDYSDIQTYDESFENTTPFINFFMNQDHAPPRSSMHYLKIKENREPIKTTSKANFWCIPKELYKREIGHNNKCSVWRNTFYQSEVATQKLKLSKQLISHESYSRSIDFNNAGNLLASGYDGTIVVWDWSWGNPILKHTQSLHAEKISHIKFLTNQILTAGKDGIIILADVHNSGIIHSRLISRHIKQCSKIGVHCEVQNVFLTCGKDGIVKNIDIREPINRYNKIFTDILHIKTVQGNSLQLYGIDINPMKPFEFIVNGEDDCVRMYDKRKILHKPVKIFQPFLPTRERLEDHFYDGGFLEPPSGNRNTASAVYNYCGTEILAVCGNEHNNNIVLYNVNDPPKTISHRYINETSFNSSITAINFYGPRSEYVVYGSNKNFFVIFDKKTEALVLKKCQKGQGKISAIEGHPHLPTLATSGRLNAIHIWEPLSERQSPDIENLQECTTRHIKENKRLRMDLTGNILF